MWRDVARCGAHLAESVEYTWQLLLGGHVTKDEELLVEHRLPLLHPRPLGGVGLLLTCVHGLEASVDCLELRLHGGGGRR